MQDADNIGEIPDDELVTRMQSAERRVLEDCLNGIRKDESPHRPTELLYRRELTRRGDERRAKRATKR
jgi:hypothetical protein